MRRVSCLMVLALLTGCVGSEDTGAVAARMEQQDDAACKGRADYQQCRQNLLSYRRQALAEQQQRQARLNAADPQQTNVNVTCFGCR